MSSPFPAFSAACLVSVVASVHAAHGAAARGGFDLVTSRGQKEEHENRWCAKWLAFEKVSPSTKSLALHASPATSTQPVAQRELR